MEEHVQKEIQKYDAQETLESTGRCNFFYERKASGLQCVGWHGVNSLKLCRNDGDGDSSHENISNA